MIESEIGDLWFRVVAESFLFRVPIRKHPLALLCSRNAGNELLAVGSLFLLCD